VLSDAFVGMLDGQPAQPSDGDRSAEPCRNVPSQGDLIEVLEKDLERLRRELAEDFGKLLAGTSALRAETAGDVREAEPDPLPEMSESMLDFAKGLVGE